MERDITIDIIDYFEIVLTNCDQKMSSKRCDGIGINFYCEMKFYILLAFFELSAITLKCTNK